MRLRLHDALGHHSVCLLYTSRSNFTGTIVSADGGNVAMEVDGQQVVLPIDQMKRAHLKGIVDFSS